MIARAYLFRLILTAGPILVASGGAAQAQAPLPLALAHTPALPPALTDDWPTSASIAPLTSALPAPAPGQTLPDVVQALMPRAAASAQTLPADAPLAARADRAGLRLTQAQPVEAPSQPAPPTVPVTTTDARAAAAEATEPERTPAQAAAAPNTVAGDGKTASHDEETRPAPPAAAETPTTLAQANQPIASETVPNETAEEASEAFLAPDAGALNPALGARPPRTTPPERRDVNRMLWELGLLPDNEAASVTAPLATQNGPAAPGPSASAAQNTPAAAPVSAADDTAQRLRRMPEERARPAPPSASPPQRTQQQRSPSRVTTLRPRGQRVELNVGRGQLLRFAQPVNTVLIAEPEVADVELIAPDVAYVFGVAPGTTNIFALSEAQELVASADLRVARDALAAEDRLREAVPDSQAAVDFLDERPRVTGEVSNVAAAIDTAAVAQSLSPPGRVPLNRSEYAQSQQINIRVRFAEVSRSELTSLGINFDALFNAGDFAFGLTTGAFLNGLGDAFGTGIAGVANSQINIDLLLDALEREGVASVLAEPNLTAVSGLPARFLAGGEFPIPVPQGEDTVTIEFKEFGVALDFLPTLLPDERIALTVAPEVSTLDLTNGVPIGGAVVPALIVRRAETNVEVASGQTIAIAGLFQREVSNNVDSIPLLGDLPILGPLFRSVRFQNQETELVILITPFLVEPERVAEAGAQPTDTLAEALVEPSAPPAPPSLAGFLLE